jgi:hypothetical protein
MSTKKLVSGINRSVQVSWKGSFRGAVNEPTIQQARQHTWHLLLFTLALSLLFNITTSTLQCASGPPRQPSSVARALWSNQLMMAPRGGGQTEIRVLRPRKYQVPLPSLGQSLLPLTLAYTVINGRRKQAVLGEYRTLSCFPLGPVLSF